MGLDQPLCAAVLALHQRLRHGRLGLLVQHRADRCAELRQPPRRHGRARALRVRVRVRRRGRVRAAARPTAAGRGWTARPRRVVLRARDAAVLARPAPAAPALARLGILPGPEGRLAPETAPPPSITGLYTVDALLAGQWATLLATRSCTCRCPRCHARLLSPSRYLVRLLRANLLEVVARARSSSSRAARGVPRWTAFRRHALPNALLPTITAGGLILAQLLTRQRARRGASSTGRASGGSCRRRSSPGLRHRADVHPAERAVVRRRQPRRRHCSTASSTHACACRGWRHDARPRPRGRAICARSSARRGARHGGARRQPRPSQRGERIAIVGESGCGKSALALSVLGLIEPPGRVDRRRGAAQRPRHRRLTERAMQRMRGREIALIFQDPMTALDPVKTIGDQIAEAIRGHEPTAGRAAARRARSSCCGRRGPAPERRLDDYPHEYSGGMRQRVMIAMALANEPDVLIADEPTTALDVTTQAQVLACSTGVVADRGTAVILITHNLGVVAEFCDDGSRHVRGPARRAGAAPDVFARRPIRTPRRCSLGAAARTARHGPLPSIPGAPPISRACPPAARSRRAARVGHGAVICCRDQVPAARADPSARPASTPSATSPDEQRLAQRRSPRRRPERRPLLRVDGVGQGLPGRQVAAAGAATGTLRAVDDVSLRGPTRRDVRHRRRVRLRQVDARPLHPAPDRADAAASTSTGRDLSALDGRDARRCGGGCRSSSRTRTRRWTRA